jgi:hypothetical protein
MKRRRPNKRLVATLDSLADALPDDDEVQGREDSSAKDQVNVIRRKSLKSKPGAMKRREKIDQGERARFKKNMAQLAAPNTGGDLSTGKVSMNNGPTATGSTTVSSTNERWAALRSFISQTLETRPDMKV